MDPEERRVLKNESKGDYMGLNRLETTGESSLQKKNCTILILFAAGIFLLPIHLRFPVLYKVMGYSAYINYPAAAAVLLSVIWGYRRWEKPDGIFLILWAALCFPFFVSNQGMEPARTTVAFFQMFFPVLVLMYRINGCETGKFIDRMLLLLNIAVMLYLVLGIEEILTGKRLMTSLRDVLQNLGFRPAELSGYLTDKRFGTIWGHPLTNALLFNSFFALNIVWCEKREKEQLLPVFFLISLAGILLCSSKTGIVICFLLMLFSMRKRWKWLLLCLAVLVILYFAGAFDGLLFRFRNTSLTTGRLEYLREYFNSEAGIRTVPLHLLRGYGSNAVLLAENPAHLFRAGFEFPLIMLAFDYGIVFAVVFLGGTFAYVSWRCIRRKAWTAWIVYFILFAQINTYNGYALRNQDVCYFFSFVTLTILSLAGLPDSRMRKSVKQDRESTDTLEGAES